MKNSKALKIIIVLFFPVFLFQLCNPPSSDNSTKATTNMEAPGLNLICQKETSSKEGIPSHSVHLDFNGKKYKLANILACESFDKNSYTQHQMPQNTMQAIGGWWAGAGEYFYLNQNPDGSYSVNYGQMYEGKETKLYDYTELIRIKKDASNNWSAHPKHDIKNLTGVYTLGGHHNSWMLIVKPSGDGINATYHAIEGMLPTIDFLKNNPIPGEGKKLKKFDVDLSDMVIDSDLGGGQLEIIFGRERITLFDIPSHQEDQLRITKDPSLAFLIE